MKQTEARAKFPDHKLVFSTAKARAFETRTLSFYVKGTNEFVASIEQRDDKAVAMIIRPGRGKNALAKFVAFAEVGSYKNVYEVEQALNAERKFDGLGAVGWEAARKQFIKTQEQDFDFAIDMLAIYFGVLENRNPGYAREQFPFLTRQGKTLYRKAYLHMEALREGAQEAAQTELETPATEFKGFQHLQPPTCLGAAPVAQVAYRMHAGRIERADADKRTVWGAEDEVIFQQVQEDHRKLSDRLAALHSARGSKISIPEFDRRKKAGRETC